MAKKHFHKEDITLQSYQNTHKANTVSCLEAQGSYVLTSVLVSTLRTKLLSFSISKYSANASGALFCNHPKTSFTTFA